jgi:hypothetical protein
MSKKETTNNDKPQTIIDESKNINNYQGLDINTAGILNKWNTSQHQVEPKRKVKIWGSGMIRQCSMCGKKKCLGVVPIPNTAGSWKEEDEICNECLEGLEVVK